MSVFPVFVDLNNKKCVVVGGGKVASRKIKAFIEFGADVLVISPEITDEVNELKNKGEITHYKREYSEGDIEGAFLVVAATMDGAVNAAVAAEATNKQILVNVVDRPKDCTFIFPSTIKKGDLVFGISTSGSYPALSKYLCKELDSILKEVDSEFIEMLKKFRARIMAEVSDEARRREILNEVLHKVLSSEGNIKVIENSEIFGDGRNEKNN